MLVVAGRITIKAEARAEAVRLATEVASATRREAGCLSYRFYADLEDPTRFFVFEEWRDAAALESHFTMPHMVSFLERVPALLEAPPEITRYEIASSGPM
jgi:quinol monooxygenase YgiN